MTRIMLPFKGYPLNWMNFTVQDTDDSVGNLWLLNCGEPTEAFFIPMVLSAILLEIDDREADNCNAEIFSGSITKN